MVWAQNGMPKGKPTFGLGAGYSNFVSGRSVSLNFQFSPDRSNVLYAGPAVFINDFPVDKQRVQPFQFWAADSARRQMGFQLGWIHLLRFTFTGGERLFFLNLHQEWYKLNNLWYRFYDLGWCGTDGREAMDSYVPTWIMESSIQLGIQIKASEHLGFRASGGAGGMLPMRNPQLIVRGVFKAEVFVKL